MDMSDLWFLDYDPQSEITLRVRLLPSIAEVADSHPELLELSFTPETQTLGGESRRGFDRFLIDFEERARHFLEEVGDGILVATRRKQDSCTMFFYANSREEELKRFSQLQGTITPLPLSVEIRPDPDWTEYRNLLAATGNG